MDRLRLLCAIAALLVVATPVRLSLAAGTPAKKCTFARVADWPVRVAGGKVTLQGHLNGHEIRVLLDTGAGRSLIPRPAAVRLGLQRQPFSGYRAWNVDGELRLESATVNEFRIGQAVRRNWEALVALDHEAGENISVYLGVDFLGSYDVEFDLVHNAVRLYASEGCEDVSLAYWAPEGASVVPIEMDGELRLPVQLNGQRVWATLDSGATRTVVESSTARQHGLLPNGAGVQPGGCIGRGGRSPADMWIGMFKSFTIGNETIRNPTLYFSDIWQNMIDRDTGRLRPPERLQRQPEVLLGLDFLLAHRVLIAHSQQKLYFSYVGGAVFPTKPGKLCNEAQG